MIVRRIVSSLLIAFMNHHLSNSLDHNLLDHLIQSLKKDESIHRVDLILDATDQSSSTPSLIARRFADEFSTTTTSLIRNQTLTENQCVSSTEFTKMMSKQHNLRIGIIDLQNQPSLKTKLLNSMLDFIQRQNPAVRGKIMIIVVDDDNSKYESYLKLGWRRQFLNMLIVQFLAIQGGKRKHLSSLQDDEFTAFVHAYDPFCNLYSKNILTPNSLLYLNRSRDMNKFPLILSSYIRKFTKSDNIQGFQVELIKAFAEVLNFEPIPAFYDGIRNYQFAKAPEGKFADLQLFDQGVVYGKEKNNDHACTSFESRLEISQLSSIYAVVRQYQLPEIKVPYAFIKTSLTLFLIAIVFWITPLILQYDMKNWTIIEISSLLIGASNESRRSPRLSEAILKMCLLTVSAMTMVYFNDDMINVLLGHQEFLNLNSFQELSESNLEFYMRKETSTRLNFSIESAAMRAVLNRTHVINFNRESNHLVIISTPDSKHAQLLTAFGKPGGGSISTYYIFENVSEQNSRMTLIDEPLSRSVHVVAMNSTASFSAKLTGIVTRLHETGLIDYWHKKINDQSWFRKRRQKRYHDDLEVKKDQSRIECQHKPDAI
ncbi:hypothetical protein QAD02_004501 [Eretmocerus hayati]|uniref:Uncharacterized protein n=1 Tax=Eretmocerus hayati TaxID=131215 RepID=A0ACC2NPP8_9HYME|nr:hypothetical protein QAD02_004501 [Eretmocerus hayati]